MRLRKICDRLRMAALVLGLAILPAAAQASGDIETAGEVLSVAMPVLAGGFSLTRGDEEGTVQLLKSVFLSSALAFGIDESVQSGNWMKDVVSPIRSPDGKTFPSRRTVNAFSAASFMDHRYGWKYGLPSYLVAGFVAYSRVEADENGITDVVAGALLSWTVSHLFVTPLPVSASGSFDGDRALLRISARW